MNCEGADRQQYFHIVVAQGQPLLLSLLPLLLLATHRRVPARGQAEDPGTPLAAAGPQGPSSPQHEDGNCPNPSYLHIKATALLLSPPPAPPWGRQCEWGLFIPVACWHVQGEMEGRGADSVSTPLSAAAVSILEDCSGVFSATHPVLGTADKEKHLSLEQHQEQPRGGASSSVVGTSDHCLHPSPSAPPAVPVPATPPLMSLLWLNSLSTGSPCQDPLRSSNTSAH